MPLPYEYYEFSEKCTDCRQREFVTTKEAIVCKYCGLEIPGSTPLVCEYVNDMQSSVTPHVYENVSDEF